MNSIQKRSLLISFILAFEYGALIQFPNLIVWLMFIMPLTLAVGLIYLLDLKVNKSELVHNLKFLILPALFNFGAVFFLRYMTQTQIVYVLVILVLLINFYLFIALRKVFNLEERAAIFQRNIIVNIKYSNITFLVKVRLALCEIIPQIK